MSCTFQTERTPFELLEGGAHAFGDVVLEDGVSRLRTVTDKQVLQFICDDTGAHLKPGELAYYTGTLYDLSNYRTLLLDEGFSTEVLYQTASVLDTTLVFDDERVRLIYTSSGTIRILFEKEEGVAHILLKE